MFSPFAQCLREAEIILHRDPFEQTRPRAFYVNKVSELALMNIQIRFILNF